MKFILLISFLSKQIISKSICSLRLSWYILFVGVYCLEEELEEKHDKKNNKTIKNCYSKWKKVDLILLNIEWQKWVWGWREGCFLCCRQLHDHKSPFFILISILIPAIIKTVKISMIHFTIDFNFPVNLMLPEKYIFNPPYGTRKNLTHTHNSTVLFLSPCIVFTKQYK